MWYTSVGCFPAFSCLRDKRGGFPEAIAVLLITSSWRGYGHSLEPGDAQGLAALKESSQQ